MLMHHFTTAIQTPPVRTQLEVSRVCVIPVSLEVERCVNVGHFRCLQLRTVVSTIQYMQVQCNVFEIQLQMHCLRISMLLLKTWRLVAILNNS